MKNFFRTSKSKSTLVNLAKTLGYSIVFWLIFLLIIPRVINSYETQYFKLLNPNRALGGFLFITFAFINIWSGITMSRIGKGTPLPLDCPRQLVIRGPYKFVRNPMAIGGIGLGISVGVFIGSLFTIIYSIIGAIIWHLIIRPIEEKDLEDRFGEEFLNYKAKVSIWIPIQLM